MIKISDFKTKIICSKSDNPWYNLALEEYLLNQVNQGEVILYLWQNQNTVVIGRNQNAWKECRCKLLEQEGGKLARRLSGGGAVFHDLGNLNFTFIMDRELYDLERQLKVILEAVKGLGIEAEFSGRNDLLVEGKKFSGNAFYFTTKAAYHHGTILVDTDFQKLVTYLQVSQEKIKSKGIDSVRSRVINLKEIKPDLTIDIMKKAMEKSFRSSYGGWARRRKINPASYHKLDELYQKYSSWDWLYGRTPVFDITFSRRFDWGEIELGLTLKKGHIQQAVIFSDAMNSELIQAVANSLSGSIYKLDDILYQLDKITVNETEHQIINDLKEWLQTKSI